MQYYDGCLGYESLVCDKCQIDMREYFLSETAGDHLDLCEVAFNAFKQIPNVTLADFKTTEDIANLLANVIRKARGD